jgi:hypothetical protein
MTDNQFDWMRETFYEPSRQLEPMPGSPPRGLMAALIFAGCIVAGLALWGMAALA